MQDAAFVGTAAVSVVATLLAAVFFARVLARRFPRLARPPEGDRNAALDGLRGYLALSVVCHHFIIWMGLTRFGLGWRAPAFHPFNHLGLGAVALFFMITGYVFAPWIARGDIAAWPRLILRRLFRLQPLVVLSVALVGAIGLARGGAPGAGDGRALMMWLSCWSEPGLFGLPEAGRINAHVLWSLKFEWLFTLMLLPLCMVAARALRGRAPAWLAPVFVLLLISGLRALSPAAGGPLLLFASPFLIGMIAHEALTRDWLRAPFTGPWAPAVAAAALAFATFRASTPFTPVQMAFYGLFFCCVAARRDQPLLIGAGAQALGAWSYPIYLLHGICLSLLFVEAGPLAAAAPASALLALLPAFACLAVAAAALAHAFIERPADDFGRKLAARRITARSCA
jgi:peptidoglycan/LPS O-acetylase OafA/YrhL